MGFFFISYKHTDRAFVDDLIAHLEEAEIISWIDASIKAGEEWKPTIDRWIQDSVGVLVVVTPESLMSPYVTYEWSFAKGLGDKKKPVIPIFLRLPMPGATVEFNPNPANVPGIQIEIHPRLRDLQGFDFTDEANRDWDRLIDKLKEILSERDISDALKDKEGELNSSNDSVWQRAIDSLQTWRDNAAITVLGKAANKHDNQEVQKACAIALCQRTNNTDPRAIPGLQLIVASGAWAQDGIGTVVQALGKLAKLGYEAALEVLISALSNDPQKYVVLREQAANELGLIKDKRALNALLKTLNEGSADPVTNAIILGLGSQGSPDAIEPLKILLNKVQNQEITPFQTEDSIRLTLGYILRTLAVLGDDGISAVIEYARTNSTHNPGIESIVVDALERVKDQAIPLLKLVLSRESDYVLQQKLGEMLSKIQSATPKT